MSNRNRTVDSIDWLLRMLAVIGLLLSAYVHLKLATTYSRPKGAAALSQTMVFQIQGVVAILVAVFLALKSNVTALLIATLVLIGSLAAVLLYTTGDPGRILFLPDMGDSTWKSPPHDSLKVLSTIAEAVGGVSAYIALMIAIKHNKKKNKQRVARAG